MSKEAGVWHSCTKTAVRRRSFCALILLFLVTASCGCVEIRVITPTVPAPMLLPYPDSVDPLEVYDAVTTRINEVRTGQGLETLVWDEVLQDYASVRVWEILRGTSVDEIDGYLSEELGEPVAELRACMSDDVTTPDALAQVAVEAWLGDHKLSKILLDDWQRIGVGFDWGCPTERGVMLVVLLAGRPDVREG